MARLRFLAVATMALVLAGSPTQTGRSEDDLLAQSGKAYSSGGANISFSTVPARVVSTDDGPCVIYALSDMGYDSDLGKWIAQTVPEMIEPKSWQGHWEGAGVLRYYAPKNILIVKNSAAIQTKIARFLLDLKKSMPKESESTSVAGKKSPHSSVVPADYRTPALLRTSSHAPEPSSYPVPAPVKQPKHLFHFIIRYEGDGIIDENVVKFMKTYYQAEKTEKSETAAGNRYLKNPPVYFPSYPGTVTEADDRKEEENKKDDKKGNTHKQP